MSMTTREQFEAWFENDVVDKKVTFPAFEDGEYTEGDLYDDQLYFMLQAMWMAWQAASKASEQQLAAVVAENEVLKTAAEFATADDMWIEQADGMLDYRYVDWYVDVLKTAMETPATDAFLAEVRAQGVDAAIEQLHKKFEGTGHIGVPVMVLESFAAQLRQGAEHE